MKGKGDDRHAEGGGAGGKEDSVEKQAKQQKEK